jgi:hypothetical protein
MQSYVALGSQAEQWFVSGLAVNRVGLQGAEELFG